MDIEAELIPLSDEDVAYREAWAAGAFQREYDVVTVARQACYQSTSDPIFTAAYSPWVTPNVKI